MLQHPLQHFAKQHLCVCDQQGGKQNKAKVSVMNDSSSQAHVRVARVTNCLFFVCHRVKGGSGHRDTITHAATNLSKVLFANNTFALTLRQTNNTFALFVFFVCHRLSLESLFFVWQRCCLQARPLPCLSQSLGVSTYLCLCLVVVCKQGLCLDSATNKQHLCLVCVLCLSQTLA